jgi:hypothetical protein
MNTDKSIEKMATMRPLFGCLIWLTLFGLCSVSGQLQVSHTVISAESSRRSVSPMNQIGASPMYQEPFLRPSPLRRYERSIDQGRHDNSIGQFNSVAAKGERQRNALQMHRPQQIQAVKRRSVRSMHRLRKRALSVTQGLLLGAVGGALVTKKFFKGAKKLGKLALKKRHVRSTDWLEQLAVRYEPTLGQVRQQVQQVVQSGLKTVQPLIPRPPRPIRLQLSRFPAAFQAATGLRLPDFDFENAPIVSNQEPALSIDQQSNNRAELVNQVLNNESPVAAINWPPAPSVQWATNSLSGSSGLASNPAADIAASNSQSNNETPRVEDESRLSSNEPIVAVESSESSFGPQPERTAYVVSNGEPEVAPSTSEETLSNTGFESPEPEVLPNPKVPVESATSVSEETINNGDQSLTNDGQPEPIADSY